MEPLTFSMKCLSASDVPLKSNKVALGEAARDFNAKEAIYVRLERM